MEIKRKVKMVINTDRQFIIRYSQDVEQIECEECDSKMLTAEQLAALFDIKQREIFQFIEKGAVHFIETETNSVTVCLSSLAKLLEKTSTKSNHDQLPGEISEAE